MMPHIRDTSLSSSTAPEDHLLELVQSYLEICNRALACGKDDPLVTSILCAHTDAAAQRAIAVDLVDDLPQKKVSVVYADHTLSVDPVQRSGSASTWRLNRSYLEQVVAHPEEYIHNPARLDWEWMIDRESHLQK